MRQMIVVFNNEAINDLPFQVDIFEEHVDFPERFCNWNKQYKLDIEFVPAWCRLDGISRTVFTITKYGNEEESYNFWIDAYDPDKEDTIEAFELHHRKTNDNHLRLSFVN